MSRRFCMSRWLPLTLVVAAATGGFWVRQRTARAQSESNENHPRAQYGSPLLLEGSNCVMVPFGGDGQFRGGKLAFGPAFFLSDTLSGGVGSPVTLQSALSLGSCFDAGEIHWNNAIFYDNDSRQSHLLLNRRAVITRFMIPRSEPSHAPAYLLLAIADSDTNGDGMIDERDATRLFVADPEGRALVPVTPAGSRFDTATFNSNGDALFVGITLDPDNTHRFGPGNPVALLRVDPLHPGMGVPLWTDDLPNDALRIATP